MEELQMRPVWSVSGNFYAPEGVEDDELNGTGFVFRFVGPELFRDAISQAIKLARNESGVPENFRVEIAELSRNNDSVYVT